MAGSDVVHVSPLNDLIEHDTSGSGECVCVPQVEPVGRENGSVGWQVIHHSLDGRELSDADRGQP